MKPGATVPDPTEPGRTVRVIRLTPREDYAAGCVEVLGRETAFRCDFVLWIADANGKRCASVVRGPYAHSFGCTENEGRTGS